MFWEKIRKIFKDGLEENEEKRRKWTKKKWKNNLNKIWTNSKIWKNFRIKFEKILSATWGGFVKNWKLLKEIQKVFDKNMEKHGENSNNFSDGMRKNKKLRKHQKYF